MGNRPHSPHLPCGGRPLGLLVVVEAMLHSIVPIKEISTHPLRLEMGNAQYSNLSQSNLGGLHYPIPCKTSLYSRTMLPPDTQI